MRQRIIKVICKVIFLLGLLLGYYFLNSKYNFGIPCPINKFTGYLCPGCGITRCIFSIIEFRLKDAFFYNPLVFILIPFFLLYFVYTHYLYIVDKEDENICMKMPKWIWTILLIVVILFGILRNLI